MEAILGKKKASNDAAPTLEAELSPELGKLESAHKRASEANLALNQAMKMNLDNLKLLSLPLEQLKKEIPSMADLDEESEAHVAEVHRFLMRIPFLEHVTGYQRPKKVMGSFRLLWITYSFLIKNSQ